MWKVIIWFITLRWCWKPCWYCDPSQWLTVTVSFGAPSGYHLFNLSVNCVAFLRFFATNNDKRAVLLGFFEWPSISHSLTKQSGETFVVTKRVILRCRHFDYCSWWSSLFRRWVRSEIWSAFWLRMLGKDFRLPNSIQLSLLKGGSKKKPIKDGGGGASKKDGKGIVLLSDLSTSNPSQTRTETRTMTIPRRKRCRASWATQSLWRSRTSSGVTWPAWRLPRRRWRRRSFSRSSSHTFSQVLLPV